MKSGNALLLRLLQAMVDEWGKEEIASALRRTSDRRSDFVPDHAAKQPEKRTDPKLTAVLQVQRADIDSERKGPMLRLADRYDRHEFLPTVADVREFIMMMGERPRGMKDRREAFRTLLGTLAKLSPDRLEQIVQSALHTGPAELGPLSEAIAAAGVHMSRFRRRDD